MGKGRPLGPLIRLDRWREPQASEITSESLYLRRREFLASSALAATAVAWPGLAACKPEAPQLAALEATRNTALSTDEPLTDHADATTYNNFYEFGTDKGAPAKRAGSLITQPWTVEVAGEVTKPGKLALEDLLKPHALEERIYRLRCVEAWSMVIPWIGISLGDVVKRFEPTSRAKYVAFQTLLDPEQMPGQRSRVLDWPYQESLRIDEATNHWRCLVSGCTARSCRIRTGHPCVW